MFHKSEFADWRKDEITQQFYKDVMETINVYGMQLIDRETPDVPYEQLLRGRIQGLYAALKWHPDFVEERDVTPTEGDDEV